MVTPNSLTIVIPALNEELAIGATIRRCLEASASIRAISKLAQVEIIVVSDGSTDRTAEIAKSFAGVQVIEFEMNRGYGAAIKEGFRLARGEWVGFIDADGTCDPLIFGELCATAKSKVADIVLGSRLGPNNKMPPIRRLGNRIYALLLGFLCGRFITDTASGMRVIRRSILSRLYPLPNGMHFTPSMSAKALMGGFSIVEVPMPYEERVGRSKLHVIKDGIRFFQAIFNAVLAYRPERLFMLAFVATLLIAVMLAAHPIEFYAKHHSVEEWMIYRFIVCFFLGIVGYLSLTAAVLSNRMVELNPRLRRPDSFWTTVFSGLFQGRAATVLSLLFLTVGGALLGPAISEYLSYGEIHQHWSRFLVGNFSLLMVVQISFTRVVLYILEIWKSEADSSILTTESNSAGSADVVPSLLQV